jgi:hypothetical protein
MEATILILFMPNYSDFLVYSTNYEINYLPPLYKLFITHLSIHIFCMVLNFMPLFILLS